MVFERPLKIDRTSKRRGREKEILKRESKGSKGSEL